MWVGVAIAAALNLVALWLVAGAAAVVVVRYVPQPNPRQETRSASEAELLERIAEPLYRARRRRAILTTMVRHVPGRALFAVDQDLRILYCGGGPLLAAGYEPDDLIGHQVAEVIRGDPSEVVEGYRAALSGEVVEVVHSGESGTHKTLFAPVDLDGVVVAAVAASQLISPPVRRA